MPRIRAQGWLLSVLLSVTVWLIALLVAGAFQQQVSHLAVLATPLGDTSWIIPPLLAGTVQPQLGKLLYRTSEAKAALGCGTTKLYELINNGTLEARRLGKRTYITGESLQRLIDSLPPVVTPTMAKAEHDRWSGHRNPRARPQEDEPDAVG
jgi:hypothetical protein